MSNNVNSKDCKGCKESVRISETAIEKELNKLKKEKNVNMVEEETYQKRLNLCRNCSALQYGTTCKYCGCIVQIKAKIKGASCPFPGDSKW